MEMNLSKNVIPCGDPGMTFLLTGCVHVLWRSVLRFIRQVWNRRISVRCWCRCWCRCWWVCRVSTVVCFQPQHVWLRWIKAAAFTTRWCVEMCNEMQTEADVNQEQPGRTSSKNIVLSGQERVWLLKGKWQEIGIYKKKKKKLRFFFSLNPVKQMFFSHYVTFLIFSKNITVSTCLDRVTWVKSWPRT